MLERLLELTAGAKNLKENVTLRLGMVGQLSTSREINAAWNETKRKQPNSILKNLFLMIGVLLNGMMEV